MLGWRLGSIVLLSFALWPRRLPRKRRKMARSRHISRRVRYFYVRYFFVSNYLAGKKPLQVAADTKVNVAPPLELRECPWGQRYSQGGELQIDILNVYQEWAEAVFSGLLRSSFRRVAHICAISRNPVKDWRSPKK